MSQADKNASDTVQRTHRLEEAARAFEDFAARARARGKLVVTVA